MQLKITKEQLLGPLTRVNAAVERSPAVTFLTHVLMKSTGNEVSLTGSNIEIDITETIPGVSGEKGAVLFPGKSILEFCKWQPAETEFLFESTEKDLSVTAIGTESVLNSKTHLADDFPVSADNEWDAQCTLNAADFAGLISKTAFSMGHKDVRFYLNGMLFEIDKKEIVTVTTDGHRLSKADMSLDSFDAKEKTRAIVPGKAVKVLASLLSNASDTVEFSVNQRHLQVSAGNILITAKLLEGTFPDWSAAVPKDTNRTVVADRLLLLNKMKMVKNSLSFEAGDTGAIAATLDIVDNKIMFKGKNIVQEVASSIDVELTGEKIACSLNTGYLIDVLETVKSEQIKFEFRDAESACIVRPVDEGDSSMYLIMLLV